MRVLTLAYHLSLPQLRREMVYTQARVKRRTHLKAFVDSLKTQLDGVTVAIATETALLDAVEYGRAGVDDADEQLDGLFMETTAAAKLASGSLTSCCFNQANAAAASGSGIAICWQRLRIVGNKRCA